MLCIFWSIKIFLHKKRARNNLFPTHLNRLIILSHSSFVYTGQPFSSFKTGGFKERDFEIVKIGLERPREELYERINARVLQMMDEGLEEEARAMLPYRDLPALQAMARRLFDPGRLSRLIYL